jgi:hypothetical protein
VLGKEFIYRHLSEELKEIVLLPKVNRGERIRTSDLLRPGIEYGGAGICRERPFLEECVDERGHGGTAQHQEHAKQQEDADNRQQPPLLVLPCEMPEIVEHAGASLVQSGLFEFVSNFFAHITSVGQD